MALLYTPSADLGKSLPEFQLLTVENKKWNSKDLPKNKPIVIVFMCSHCPYVKAIEDRLIDLGHKLQKLGVCMVGICSNDPTDYKEDSPENLLKRFQDKKYSFPYLIDTEQTVAKTFGAVCTPDFFVYDNDHKLSYRGRLDDSWKDPSKVTRQELYDAVQTLIKGEDIKLEQTPSMGCSIKWKED